MSRFRTRPDHLVDSIVALAEQSNRLALDAAMSAARADGPSAVDEVCRLAVGAGVAGGEIAWLVGELEALTADEETLAEAAVAVAGMQSCMRMVAVVVQEVADRGAPPEITSAAAAL